MHFSDLFTTVYPEEYLTDSSCSENMSVELLIQEVFSEAHQILDTFEKEVKKKKDIFQPQGPCYFYTEKMQRRGESTLVPGTIWEL